MLKVIYYKVIHYQWQCPACHALMKDDYAPEDELICDHCGERFEPEEG